MKSSRGVFTSYLRSKDEKYYDETTVKCLCEDVFIHVFTSNLLLQETMCRLFIIIIIKLRQENICDFML